MPAKPRAGTGSGNKTGKATVKQTGKQTGKRCPICGKPAQEGSRPFCSERCRSVDLNRWLSNSYVIPAAGNEEDDAD